MTVIINGTSGITDVNGSAAAPAITGTDTDTGVFFGTNTVSLSTGGTERLQIDSSGNAGLGVTPSAWLSSTVATQIGNYGSVYAFKNSGNVYLNNNTYVNSGGSDVYLNTAPAGRYRISDNTHIWYNAPSGTAGTTATLTQAMTLDASGNLLIGATSGSYPLLVKKAASSSDHSTISIVSGTAGYAQVLLGDTASDAVGYLAYNNSTNALEIATNGSERARIDSSGNLLVGTTTDSGKVYSKNANNTDTLVAHSTSTTYQQTLLLLLAARNTTNTSFYAIAYYNLGASAYKFIVADSGNVTNANNSYGGISDIKLKENITDATPKLADLMKVKVRQYNFKSEPSNKQLGVVAQELEQVFPSMVDESPDKDAEGNDLGTTTKSVKYSVFVPMLIKAIQEQQAIITQLQADVAALKGQA